MPRRRGAPSPQGGGVNAAPGRSLVCERCGATFSCGLGGPCWCAAEAERHPPPTAQSAYQDCLCPACLRALARERAGALKEDLRR
ncbi:MAG: cysteine-rich CWC family protein [Methylobacteriaceae bacterium]|nr:cysteine-rich CWC family protein [Methylobacteriaceae bacterium]